MPFLTNIFSYFPMLESLKLAPFVPDPYIVVHIKEDLQQDLNCPVDIVRMREHMNPFLKQNIENEAVYVQ
jgi:hypothetical protein